MDFSKKEIVSWQQPSREPAPREGMARGHQRLLIPPHTSTNLRETLLASQEVPFIQSFILPLQ